MSDRGSIVDADTIQFERTLPASVQKVWDHLTVPALTPTWLAYSEMDLRPGGHIQLRFEIAEAPGRIRAGARIHGIVSECEAPNRLSHSWIDVTQNPLLAGEAATAASRLDYEVRAGEVEGQSVLVLRHHGLTMTHLPNFAAGWHAHLDVLRATLSGEEPRPFLEGFRRLLPWYIQLARMQPGAPTGRKGGIVAAAARRFR